MSELRASDRWKFIVALLVFGAAAPFMWMQQRWLAFGSCVFLVLISVFVLIKSFRR